MKKLLLPILFVVVNSTAFAAQQPDQGAGQPQTPASAATARIAEARARFAARFQHESTHAAEATTPEPAAGQRRVRENEDEGQSAERSVRPRRGSIGSISGESAAPEARAAAAGAEDSAEICQICKEPMNEADDKQTLPCHSRTPSAQDHTFHRNCIMPWLATNDTCPTCRTVVGRVLDDADIDISRAVTDGDIALVTRFISYAIANHLNINPANRFGETALHDAARNGHEAIARLIIENMLHQAPYANINPATIYGSTPLHGATRNGHADIAAYISEQLRAQASRNSLLGRCVGFLRKPFGR